ncbi:MAG: hypothetical protein ACI9K5_003396 [Gammaproteobacteria bacterium]
MIPSLNLNHGNSSWEKGEWKAGKMREPAGGSWISGRPWTQMTPVSLRIPIALLFLAIAGGVAVPWLGGPLSGNPGLRLGILVLAGGAWVVALGWAERWATGRAALVAIVVGAIVLRTLALLGEPETSDDVYRYVWEGALVLGAESPYAIAPSDREEERLRWPQLYGRINHPEVSAAYPPLTQGACALGVLAAGGRSGLDQPDGWRRAVFSLRVLFGLADLLVLLPLAVLLRALGRSPGLLVAWAWCPLVVLESGGAGHFDSLGVLLMVAGLAAAVRLRWPAASLWIAAGALVKWLPLAAAPFLGREKRARVLSAGLVAVGIGAGFVPLLFLEGGARGLFGGLGEYAFRWESFNLGFRWLEQVLQGYFPMDESWNDARRVARVLVLGCLALTGLMLLWRRVDAPRACGVLLGLFLVGTPTLHPWYLLWIVPFLALQRSPAFLWLVAVAPLTYWPLTRWKTEGVWEEPGWLWPSVALPFLALLVFELVRRWRTRGAKAALQP